MNKTEENLWDRRYGKTLGTEEQRMIKDNLVSFFQILREWQEADNARLQKH